MLLLSKHNLSIFIMLRINCSNISNIGTRAMSTFKLALAQLSVGTDKSENIQRAVSFIKQAKKLHADIVVLPECFNSPYGTQHFKKYAEEIPGGETSIELSKAAKDNGICVIGGTIPEKDGDKLFNTCTVWDDQGQFVIKHRKMHLFDIDIKDKITFFESETLSPGNDLNTFNFKGCKIGLGICYDIRFEEMARLYRNAGCQMLVYPAAFNMTTGPLHWELLQRSRANDNQCYVVCVSPARGSGAGYIAWGHSQLTSPWAKVICDLGVDENIIVADIDLSEVEDVRKQIPISKQRRTDIYDTILQNK
ncbi:omega-amidase NIT2 [Aphidius gifuensis]|uniref:omega-amidase NIT2 n=1 Tax=Aphidius gifuensis TaxID=684658 RepID=UPI001CDC3311|nr:omega-amidase NIT2 [Aphidius gifuensis]